MTATEAPPLAGYTIGVVGVTVGPLRTALLPLGARVTSFGADPGRLVQAVLNRSLDVLALSAGADVSAVLRHVKRAGQLVEIRAALLDHVLAVAADQATAEPLRGHGIPVTVPEQSDLATEIAEQLTANRANTLPVAGHTLQVRGHAAVIDGRLVALPAAGMALLRELADRPGHVYSRDELIALLPRDAHDGHAVEVAIGRLRSALGDPRIVSTVPKRGYRLAM
jgi:uroporphyrinogen-III synthase